jgi:heterodisulfide reductase subunit B
MLELGYFPGCSLHKASRNFDESAAALFDKLSIKLTEIEDWNCCGATSGHFTDEDLSLALSARNLALAEDQGHHTVFAPCAACYNRLLSGNKAMADQRAAASANDIMAPLSYQGTVQVRSLLDVLTKEVGALKLAQMCKVQLTGIRAAAYYGCLLVRTPGIATFEDRENPTSMERMLAAVGAETVDWPVKTECCGASLAATEEAITNPWNARILSFAKKAGANCVVTACPLCQTNLDMYQWRQAKKGEPADMPVFFLTELLALALGASIGRREWRKHFVRPDALLETLSIQAQA